MLNIDARYKRCSSCIDSHLTSMLHWMVHPFIDTLRQPAATTIMLSRYSGDVTDPPENQTGWSWWAWPIHHPENVTCSNAFSCLLKIVRAPSCWNRMQWQIGMRTHSACLQECKICASIKSASRMYGPIVGCYAKLNHLFHRCEKCQHNKLFPIYAYSIMSFWHANDTCGLTRGTPEVTAFDFEGS